MADAVEKLVKKYDDLEREVESQRTQVAWWQDQAWFNDRRLAATRGVVTKLRRKLDAMLAEREK